MANVLIGLTQETASHYGNALSVMYGASHVPGVAVSVELSDLEKFYSLVILPEEAAAKEDLPVLMSEAELRDKLTQTVTRWESLAEAEREIIADDITTVKGFLAEIENVI